MAKTQCEGCYYWRPLSGTWCGSGKACHYMVETGKPKKRDGDTCLSKREGTYTRANIPFTISSKKKEEKL